MTTVARETGQDVEHEKLFGTVTVAEAGYMYIYLSNEEGASAYEVYFDDFKVEQIKSPVIQVEDYYPFGLTFNEYQRENSVNDLYQYNGKEKQDELDLGWLDYGARMYLPELGRWIVVDSKSEEYCFSSPYTYVLDNPTSALDPDGKRIYYVAGAGDDAAGWNYSEKWRAAMEDNGIQGFVRIHASHGSNGDLAFTHSFRSVSTRTINTAPISPLGRGPIHLETRPMEDEQIDNAVGQIKDDLTKNKLADGDQLNLIGYSYGSVLQAHAALKLAKEGYVIDNLFLVGSPISEKSELYQELLANGNIKNVKHINIENDLLSNPKDQLTYLEGVARSFNNDNSPHLDLARPGKGKGKNNTTYQKITEVVIKYLQKQGVK